MVWNVVGSQDNEFEQRGHVAVDVGGVGQGVCRITSSERQVDAALRQEQRHSAAG